MHTRSFLIAGLPLFGLLSFTDLWLTGCLLDSSQGRVYESNPFAHAWLSKYGWTGLVIFKLLASSIVVIATLLIATHRPRMASFLVSCACLALVGVVLYSYQMITSESSPILYPSKYSSMLVVPANAEYLP